ncbi:MAG: type IV toxin-antitoxin system AbiEi family antitoxin domain-containing protein [Planctomycetes bacterium]|nr:type IV toxin-antitoxin system AbiEi family antitoxin domain-containing protein [Planctomycetota bacterium]
MDNASTHALALFDRHGGILRTSDALCAGIHPRILYALRDQGAISLIARGLFRRADLPPLGEPYLIAVARRIPDAVVCLVSALVVHRLTTQVPHDVDIALPRSAYRPTQGQPPLRIFHFSGKAMTEGVEIHDMDGTSVRIFSAEKTLADIFKFRHRLGLDIALEALRTYRRRRGANLQAVLEFARVCRVERVMRPYLETSAA